MEVLLRHQGRPVTLQDVEFIKELIATHPEASRRKLSELLCAAWNWRQKNGSLRAMVCRGLMLALHRAGYIELPPVRQRQLRNPLVYRRAPHPVAIDRTPLCTNLRGLGPVLLRQIRRTPQEAMFNWLMHSEHYLGYTKPIGESLKFIAFAGLQPVALFAWSSAPRHLAPRDQYIGWSPAQRRQGLSGVAYNSRYLIPPWVQVPNLASYLLSQMTRILPDEWQKVYGHPVYFVETFVDTSLHRGICYRAANWIFLGRTTGRGNNDQTNRRNRTLKDVLGLPLREDFREQLIKSD